MLVDETLLLSVQKSENGIDFSYMSVQNMWVFKILTHINRHTVSKVARHYM